VGSGDGGLLQEALEHFRAKRYARAVELLGWLRREGRDRAHAAYWLGRITANRGLRDEAIFFLEEALEENPLHVEARYVRALLERDCGRADEASAHLRKVLFVDSGFLPARYALARLYAGEGRWREAERLYQEILLLLEDKEDADPVRGGEGMTVGQLREAVTAALAHAAGGSAIPGASEIGAGEGRA
jgi:tetratricopeptide (TPR) repeat protein